MFNNSSAASWLMMKKIVLVKSHLPNIVPFNQNLNIWFWVWMSLPHGRGWWDFIDFVPIITVPISFGRVSVKWNVITDFLRLPLVPLTEENACKAHKQASWGWAESSSDTLGFKISKTHNSHCWMGKIPVRDSYKIGLLLCHSHIELRLRLRLK